MAFNSTKKKDDAQKILSNLSYVTEAKMNEEILIVVITEAEYSIVRKAMDALEAMSIESHSTLERGVLCGQRAVLCKIRDMGTKTLGSVGLALTSILKSVKPTYVVEIGICFSLKSELSIGDVAICKMSSDYEYQKIVNGVVKHRVRSLSAPDPLFAQLSHFARNYKADFSSKEGVYACGDKVVDDSVFKQKILQCVPDALAGDMESYTFALACTDFGVPWAVIKGVSDDGVNKADDDQIRAVTNAVKFFTDYLQLEPNRISSKLEINSSAQTIDYKDISREIFGKKDIVTENFEGSKTAYEAHFHPELGHAWVIIYLYKAQSVPEALRIFLKSSKNPKVRIEVCLVSRNLVLEQRLTAYKSMLTQAGYENVYINSIKQFIFDRIVKGKTSHTTLSNEEQYIDQTVYRNGGEAFTTKQYLMSFIEPVENSPNLMPINVILGEGGIGKTTLCRNFAQHYSKFEQKQEFLMLVTKHDILNAYSGNSINSITDLYREYRRNQSGADSINETNFELCLSCGSIVMMIDGIDEIEAALAGMFDMDRFIDSIKQLDSILHSCKVFLTSRSVGAERFQSLENVDILNLKGFTTDDVGKYLNKGDAKVAISINRIIHKIKPASGFVNPYLLSVLSQIFASDSGSDDMSESTARLDLTDPFEYVLARLLSREIEKQSLKISIDDYYDFLEYVVIDEENSTPLEEFIRYIDVMLGGASGKSQHTSVGSYLKCLLFSLNNDRVNISHEEFVNLIRIKAGINAFQIESQINSQDVGHLTKILGTDYNDITGVKGAIASALWKQQADVDSVNSMFKKYVSHFKNETSNFSLMQSRAIYGLHALAFEYNKIKDGTSAAALLKMLHGGPKISQLCVLGNFYKIDFSGLEFVDCEFSGYQRLLSCKADSITKFKKSSFTNCSAKSGESDFTSSMFDDDCTLDEGMHLAINHSADKKEGRIERIRSDLKRVLKAMRVGFSFGTFSQNRINQNVTLASGAKLETFLSQLCTANILIFDHKTSLYQVNPTVQDHAYVLCEEGHARGQIVSAIRELST
ncbi:hypothetical protein UNDKW_0209 [Undibacterium sp. KW1]|uniref:phosphorylase family protein n=1 Tax=Undibacterium sp. KW1 TaxID=2058624 RepID=UPI001331E892|nr:NACHT domain-containing protein [Undibacterium sp. KW1]BBB58482.1 hypothetical protein UNDKW_0209 [Undibacterium sp. KW1]